MKQAVVQEDWPMIAQVSVQVAQKLMSIEVPVRNRLGTPWEGAWGTLKQMQ